MSLKESLQKLDVTNDNHWTADGLARLDTIKILAGDSTITREAVNAALPGFSRSTAATLLIAPVAPTAPVAEPVQPAVAAVVETTGDNTNDDADVGATEAPVDVAPVEAATEAQTGVVSAEETLEVEQALLTLMEEDLDVLSKAIDKQRKKIDAMITLRDAGKVGDTNGVAIQSYLAQQREQLKERARRIEAMKGINLKDILPTRAPIDSAMARRNSRGTGRPGG